MVSRQAHRARPVPPWSLILDPMGSQPSRPPARRATPTCVLQDGGGVGQGGGWEWGSSIYYLKGAQVLLIPTRPPFTYVTHGDNPDEPRRRFNPTPFPPAGTKIPGLAQLQACHTGPLVSRSRGRARHTAAAMRSFCALTWESLRGEPCSLSLRLATGTLALAWPPGPGARRILQEPSRPIEPPGAPVGPLGGVGPLVLPLGVPSYLRPCTVCGHCQLPTAHHHQEPWSPTGPKKGP